MAQYLDVSMIRIYRVMGKVVSAKPFREQMGW
jgi:hypothetical protein